LVQLQQALNSFCSDLPLVNADGMFGPQTLARVQEFQEQNDLTDDGIAGPKTWGVLDPADTPDQCAVCCGTGDLSNQAKGVALAQRFMADSARQPRPSMAVGMTVGSFSAPTLNLPSLNPIELLTATPLVTSRVTRIYGTSLDFSRIFITHLTGLQGRAFTVAVLIPGGVPGVPTGYIQVMNLGRAPDEDRVVHELAHVWQSQHHSNPTEFMRNCAACQAYALEQNLHAAQRNPALFLKTDLHFPVVYPYSPYAYRHPTPPLPFSSFGGEQIAKQVERNESDIVARISGVRPGAVDADNVRSLTNFTAIEDRRVNGIRM
jgi:hypothetical protein